MNREKKKRVNDQGSILVTVMVIAVLISVLTTMVLYVTTRNYQTKQLDYQNKKNFYAAEAALEEMRAILTGDCEAACQYAYREVMLTYAQTSAEERRERYHKEFVTYLQTVWTERMSQTSEHTLLEAIKQQIGLRMETAENITSAQAIQMDEEKGLFILKEIKAEVTNVEGYTTVIKTDLCLMAPELTWTVDSSASYQEGMQNVDAQETKEIHMPDYVVFVNWKRD